MKMYQYIVFEKNELDKEIWTCEYCRKENYLQILTGSWRLIDKSDNSAVNCDMCRVKEEEINTIAIEG